MDPKYLQILWKNFSEKIRLEDLRRLNNVDPSTTPPMMDRQSVIENLDGVATEKSSLRHDVSSNYFLSGQRLAKQGKWLLAKSSFEKSIVLNPENDGASVELGRLLFRQLGESVLAEDAFRRALKINPQNDLACSELGWINLWQGEQQLAEHFFKKALELNPKNDSAHVGLGIACFNQGKNSQAEDFFKNALALNPKNYRAVLGLGWVCSSRGETLKAENFFRKALELNPGNFNTRACLATIYRLRGEFDQARDLFEKATGLDPEKNERRLRALASISGEWCDREGGRHQTEKATVSDSDYSAMTASNYHKLEEILERKGIKLVCVQYPMRNVEQLRKIWGRKGSATFVDNENIFKEAVKKGSYTEYFIDMFGGDFGHCTAKGNELLARNIADVILREVFNEK